MKKKRYTNKQPLKPWEAILNTILLALSFGIIMLGVYLHH